MPKSSSSVPGNYLVLLKAPDGSSTGDYQISLFTNLTLPLLSSTNSIATNKEMMYTDLFSTTSSSTAICWSPHDQANQLAIAFETGILGWDIRSSE